MAVTEIIAVLCLVLIVALSLRRIRYIYLVNKIRGPSLWEGLTVVLRHVQKEPDTMALYLANLCSTYDYKPWGMWAFRGFTVFVSDLKTVSEVLKNKDLIDKSCEFYDILRTYLGNGLLCVNGPAYKTQKKVVSIAFRRALMEAQLPKINNEVSNLIHTLGDISDGTVVDVRDLMNEHMAALTWRTLSSDRTPYRDVRSIYLGVHTVTEVVLLWSVYPIYYWFIYCLKTTTRRFKASFSRELVKAKAIIRDETEYALKRMNVDDDDKAVSPFEVWSRTWYQLHGPKDMDEIAFSEAKTMLMASYDTTAFAVNTTLILLALHPEVQQRVFEEIQAIFGDSDRQPDVEDMNKLEYLEWAVKESLRLFPPAILLGRRANADVTIGGQLVPKGCSVVLNCLAVHRNPDNYKDPMKYDPLRFSPENSKDRSPYAFLPFSAGIRPCLGPIPAYLIMKATLGGIVKNFNILPGEGISKVEDIKFKMLFSGHILHSSLRFTKREYYSKQCL